MGNIKVQQTTAISNGKLVFAIVLEKEREERDSAGNYSNSRDKTVITMKNGEIYFSESRYYDNSSFDISDETHVLAREIFISQLQTDIKRRILELQQLEAVLKEIGAAELMGRSIEETSQSLFSRFKKLLPSSDSEETEK